jgi:dTDP-4-amino-4,6-dideoxygalactose transaminase
MVKYYDMSSINGDVEDLIKIKFEALLKDSNFIYNTQNFEDRFKKYTGCQHVVGVSSGTAALHLSLKAIGIEPGDAVATVSHTFRATVAAIKYCNAEPVYVDINPYNYCMDPRKLDETLKTRPDIKAVVVVHLYGNAADMKTILQVTKKYKVKVIEDCSQAHGTYIENQHVGTFGDIGTFSFFPGKGIGAFGDAGCIVTNNSRYNEYIKQARSWKEDEIGFNYRMSNLNAEFVRLKIEHYKKVLEEKRNIAKCYNRHFGNCLVEGDVKHSYHIYSVLAPHRERLIMSAAKHGVELKCHYPKPVHKLKGYKTDKYSLPVTDIISSQQVSLPIYPGVDWKRVVKVVEEFR